MRVLHRVLACVVCTAILASLLGTLFALHLTMLPVRTPGKKVHVHISPGQSLAHIASTLEEKNVIDNPRLFQLLAWAFGLSSKLQAGEFQVDTRWSRLKILRTLATGSHVLYSIRIPEGLTWWQTAEVVAQSGLTTYEAFKNAVHDRELLQEFHIPADNAEGYLFPETYRLPRPPGNRAEPIVRLMLQEFYKQIQTTLWPQGLPDPQEVHNLVILASLVERETAQPDERRTVAGVFVNRLQRGMRLQCDPTVIYGLERSFDGKLTKKQLRDADNSYNTYTHSGLPPGPICSPGLASMLATKDPEEHEYLYFVSQGDGSHYFSRTLQEHNRAVRRYLLR
ncbi:MAG: endolytic transglycosylase MltG [Desulfovermiculus sp.]|nr:endolytic transglycosylase MltG [Desulfovermiculus sp.]